MSKMEIPKYKSTPKLSDEEIIDLFSDLKPLHHLVNVVPPPVDPKTEGGIEKTQDQIQREKMSLSSRGYLVVGVGPKAREALGFEIKTGDKVLIHLQASPTLMYERMGHMVVSFESHYISNILLPTTKDKTGRIINPLQAQTYKGMFG